MLSRTEEQNKQLLKIVMALPNSEVCLHSLCFAASKRHLRLCTNLKIFQSTTIEPTITITQTSLLPPLETVLAKFGTD